MTMNRKWKQGLSVLLALIMIFTVMAVGGTASASAASAGDGVSQYYALLVVSSNLELNGSPMHDAQAVTAALRNIKTAAGRTIPRENILIVQEPDVTANTLSSVITEFFSRMDEDDFGLFFYSGHGDCRRLGGFSESYMVLKDDNGNYNRPYTVSELARTLNALPGTFFINLACCFGGGFIAKKVDGVLPSVQEDSAQFSDNVARAFSDVASDNLYNRDKFFVITEASALQAGFSERGSLNVDYSIRAFAGALGINVQSFYEGGSWAGEDQPMGNFAADVNQDGKLSFNEITRWMKDNTATNSVQCYPERSNVVLFSYEPEDTRKEYQISDITIENQICLPGEKVSMELTCTDENVPIVLYFCFNPNICVDISRGLLDVTSLGNGRYKYSVTTDATWTNGICYFEIYHPVQGIMTRLFTVAPQAKAPVTELKSFDPQPLEITPLQGMEYRITLTFDAPCWFDVQIFDSNDKIVRTLAQKDMSVIKGNMENYKKTNSYYWDGTNDAGNPVPDGSYKIKARAYNAWGEQTVTGTTAPVNGGQMPDSSTTVVMRLGSSYGMVNGDMARTTINNGVYTTIQLVGNKTMVPIRYISEVMGLRVDWDADTYNTTVTNTKTGESLVFRLDDPQLSKYDADGVLAETVDMEIPPCLIDSSTYVPVRVIAECLGFQVEYREYSDGNAYVIVSDRQPAYSVDEITELCGQASGKI